VIRRQFDDLRQFESGRLDGDRGIIRVTRNLGRWRSLSQDRSFIA
jgi:hypothetical protein